MKTLVLKYPEIRSYVSTIPWSYKKKIVNRPVLYTRHYGKFCFNPSLFASLDFFKYETIFLNLISKLYKKVYLDWTE